jgi:hypothetical protein
VFVGAGSNELDLHSNDVFGRGAATTCTSRAVTFDVTTGSAPPTGPLGIVRNNIFHPGACTTRYDVEEASAGADPRLLQNNDFFFQAAGDVLYRDEATTNLTTVSGVNALTATMASANISVNPAWNATFHLMVGSPCIDVGVATGAPATDIDGDARPNGAGFDIGADEYHP